MYYVLLSPNDGELLKKAHQMLLDGGVNDDAEWNKYYNPDDKEGDIIALNISCGGFRWMNYHNHKCAHPTTTPITLTTENLTESVNTVLAAYKEAQK